jgi:hypothetical protein
VVSERSTPSGSIVWRVMVIVVGWLEIEREGEC